jgi:hypothetical protein
LSEGHVKFEELKVLSFSALGAQAVEAFLDNIEVQGRYVWHQDGCVVASLNDLHCGCFLIDDFFQGELVDPVEIVRAFDLA